MKNLKLLIVSLLVFAGGKLAAQNACINNSTPSSFTYNTEFVFDCSGTPVSVYPGSSCTTLPSCGGTLTLTEVVVTLVDGTCSPVMTAEVHLPGGTIPYTGFYNPCVGTTIYFVLTQAGSDYIVDIFQ